ncbi:MAG TPA: ATP-binding protein [Anaerolineaceae bacterium]|nr:ATP-binding protein [Anaerolineaceae bacterium]
MSTRIFPGRYESLAEIAEFVRLEAKEAELSFKEIFELETAVDEAVSNIIEHAYGGEGIGDITCTATRVEDGIQIILEDHGQPFDPSCVPVPDINAHLKNRKNHGLGYFLMCELMDDVKFEFSNNFNKLTLFKQHM